MGIQNLIDPFSVKDGSNTDLDYVQNIGFLQSSITINTQRGLRPL